MLQPPPPPPSQMCFLKYVVVHVLHSVASDLKDVVQLAFLKSNSGTGKIISLKCPYVTLYLEPVPPALPAPQHTFWIYFL